jgi:hypothetical protein
MTNSPRGQARALSSPSCAGCLTRPAFLPSPLGTGSTPWWTCLAFLATPPIPPDGAATAPDGLAREEETN